MTISKIHLRAYTSYIHCKHKLRFYLNLITIILIPHTYFILRILVTMSYFPFQDKGYYGYAYILDIGTLVASTLNLNYNMLLNQVKSKVLQPLTEPKIRIKRQGKTIKHII